MLVKSKSIEAVSFSDLRKAALIVRALNHKLRMKMVDYLDGNSQTVTDIMIEFRLEQSVASQHLAILRRHGIVATEKVGKYVFYSTDMDRIDEISSWIDAIK